MRRSLAGRCSLWGGKATAASGDPKAYIDKAIARQPGRIIAFKANVTDVTNTIYFGASSGKDDYPLTNFRLTGDTLTVYENGAILPVIAIPTDTTEYVLIIILRATGAVFLMKTGNGYWKRLWSTATNSTSPLYVGVSNRNAAAQIDFIRPCNYKHLPPPILSDSFAGTDGSADGRLSDGLGHLETTGIGSGGGWGRLGGVYGGHCF